jgi:hypothetical protein
MKLTIHRRESVGGATIGKLHIDGVFACATLEDEVREIEGAPVLDWKIKGATAIPQGIYRVTLEQSGRFGPDTPTINDVPGFKYIRMHAGNTSADTEGCILLGMQATEVSLVGGTSRPAVNLVKQELRGAIARGEAITIEIINARGLA